MFTGASATYGTPNDSDGPNDPNIYQNDRDFPEFGACLSVQQVQRKVIILIAPITNPHNPDNPIKPNDPYNPDNPNDPNKLVTTPITLTCQVEQEVCALDDEARLEELPWRREGLKLKTDFTSSSQNDGDDCDDILDDNYVTIVTGRLPLNRVIMPCSNLSRWSFSCCPACIWLISNTAACNVTSIDRIISD